MQYSNKIVTWKMDNFYILLTLLLSTILPLITIGIYDYYCHRNNQSKQKQILPYYRSNDKFKEISITNVIVKNELYIDRN